MASELEKLDTSTPILYYHWDAKFFKELQDLQTEFLELMNEVEMMNQYEDNINDVIIPQHNQQYNFKVQQGTINYDIDKPASTELTGHLDERWIKYGHDHLNYGMKLIFSSLAKDRLY